MRFNPAAVVALAAALMVSTVAKADVVFGNLSSTGTTGLSSINTEFLASNQAAVGFTVPANQPWSLDSVVFGLSAPSGSANVTATLFTAVSGTPGSAVGSWSSLQAVTGSTRQKYTFADGPSSIAPGDYFVVLTSDAAFNVFASAEGANSAPTAQNNSGWSFASWLGNQGAGWNSNLMVAGSAVSIVPEPSTYALAGVGLVAAGLLRRYRKSRRAAV